MEMVSFKALCSGTHLISMTLIRKSFVCAFFLSSFGGAASDYINDRGNETNNKKLELNRNHPPPPRSLPTIVKNIANKIQ